MPFYPFLVLEVGSAFRVPTFRNYILVNPRSGFTPGLGSASSLAMLELVSDYEHHL
jgi:hypothetical protein